MKAALMEVEESGSKRYISNGMQGVLFLASDFKPRPGGRGEYVDNLARGLISNGAKTRVVAVLQPEHKEHKTFLESYEEWVTPFVLTHDSRPQGWIGDKIMSCAEVLRCLGPSARHLVEKGGIFRASTESIARFRELLRRESPEIVVFDHLDLPLYAFALHLSEWGMPYAVLVHGREIPCFRWRVNDFVRRRSVLRRASCIVANSGATKAYLDDWKMPSGKVVIVNPPVSEEALHKSSDEQCRSVNGGGIKLVTLCRLEKGKAIDVVLQALAILFERGIPCSYLVGGTGSERSSLESLATELGLGERVQFLGQLSGERKWRVLRDSDVFVMPSRTETGWMESFGIAFVEAAAFGLPTVGSRSGGISEAVVDGVTGILVTEDSPTAVADALSMLYQNPVKRLEMGRAGMQWAKRFAPTVIAKQFLAHILSGFRQTADQI